jgi:hypothetical protein
MPNILASGEVYPVPLDEAILTQFKERLLGEKRVIAVADFVLGQHEVEVPIRVFPRLWLCDYVVRQAGQIVTSAEILDDGFPVADRARDRYAPIRKGLRYLTDMGLPIGNCGTARYDRVYELPVINSALIRYVEDPEEFNKLLARYRYPSQGAAYLGELNKEVKSSVREATGTLMARLKGIKFDEDNDTTPRRKRLL